MLGVLLAVTQELEFSKTHSFHRIVENMNLLDFKQAHAKPYFKPILALFLKFGKNQSFLEKSSSATFLYFMQKKPRKKKTSEKKPRKFCH